MSRRGEWVVAAKEDSKIKVGMTSSGPQVSGDISIRQVLKLAIGLLIAALIGVMVFLGLILAGLFSLPDIFSRDEVDRTPPPVLKSIEDLEQLRAAVGNFQVLLDIESDTKFVPSWISGERSLVVVQGTVDAYVDLADMTDDAVVLSEDGTSVEITLPEVQLGEPNLDLENTYVYDEDRGFADRVGDFFASDDASDLYVKAEEKLDDAAAASELKERAATNARNTIASLCRSLGVEVAFVD